MTLKIGDKAPYFEGVDQNGNTIILEQFKGKKLVLYFYPKDNTPGCTAEACNLRDNYNSFLSQGYNVVGVSADSVKSHQNFIQKYNLPFPLISDTEKKILMAYHAYGEKKMYGKTVIGTIRKTYVIDEKGNIEKIIEKVDTKNHAIQILKNN
ncbi:MAG: thioredoxin-dependent thiol peroxidase [Bacteroidales bacterium]